MVMSRLTMHEKLLKIGAKKVRRVQYIAFPPAEVAISRALFGCILRAQDHIRTARALL